MSEKLFVSIIDLSNSIVDSKFYVDRTTLLDTELASLTVDARNKVNEFVNCSLNLRTLVGELGGTGYVIYPDMSCHISNIPGNDTKYTGLKSYNTVLYSIVTGIEETLWSFALSSDEYLNFRNAANDIKSILGWDIGEYKTIDIDGFPTLTYDALEQKLRDV